MLRAPRQIVRCWCAAATHCVTEREFLTVTGWGKSAASWVRKVGWTGSCNYPPDS